MTRTIIILAGFFTMTTPAQAAAPKVGEPIVSADQMCAVAPALGAYTRERLIGSVWERPGLSKRDRSLVTMAALIALGQPAGLRYYADLALKNGVTPAEISETITHLAYYAGWGNAMAAVPPVAEVFAAHGVGEDSLPPVLPEPLPLDEAAEAQRKQTVSENFGAVAPGLVEDTTNYLFRDLWLRPGLAPRDRSLITVAALIASGQVAQVPYHLNRAMDNGLTQEQAAEVINQLAFYAGWPKAMSALPVAKEVFAKRVQDPR
jgi:4-carboxymuconolactone decarboxylase